MSFIDSNPPALKSFVPSKARVRGSIPSPWHEATTDSVWQRMAGSLGPLMRSHGFSAGYIYIYSEHSNISPFFLSFFPFSSIIISSSIIKGRCRDICWQHTMRKGKGSQAKGLSTRDWDSAAWKEIIIKRQWHRYFTQACPSWEGLELPHLSCTTVWMMASTLADNSNTKSRWKPPPMVRRFN